MTKICIIKGCLNYIEGATKYCASHNHEIRKKNRFMLIPKKICKIPRQSAKMKEANDEYARESKEWLKGKMCVVYPHLKATTTHHAKGRGKYLMDKRFWVPASMEGHQYIELHPVEAYRKGWTVSRLN